MKKIHLGLGLLLLTVPLFAQDAEDEDLDLRKRRSAAVSVELGMNSLASLAGIKGTYFVAPQFAMDGGLGLSSSGLRPGVYGRYLFTPAKFSPFVYGGAKYGLGSGGRAIEVEDPETGTTYEVETKPSAFLDFGLGIDYLAHNGFYFTGGLGWSQLLGGRNYEWAGNPPPEDFDDMMALVLGSGLALSLSVGYAF